jgi:predicted permease
MILISSLRHAWIRHARNKGLFALVVAALGLTLGVVVCAIQFTHLVTSQPLPYPEQARLVVIEQLILDHIAHPRSRDLSYPAIELLHRESQGVLSASVMIDQARDLVTSHPAQPLVTVGYISDGYAELFAPTMALGRFPGAGEDSGEQRPLAVISHTAWRDLFDLRRDVLGLRIRTAAGVDFEVVGVTAREFVEPEFYGPGKRTAVWLPWAFNPSPRHWGWASNTDRLTLAGRLPPDTDARQVGERLSQLLSTRWAEEVGASAGDRQGWSTRVELTPAQQVLAGNAAEVAPLLLAGTLGLFVITLVNIIHLLLARVAERTREFSIQRALGASHRHVFGQVLADMGVLMLPVGVMAVLVASAGCALVRHLLASLLPRLAELSIGWPTAALTLAASLALALLLAGIAVGASLRSTANASLHNGRQGTTAKVSRRLRMALMASQIGAAGLLIAVSFGLFREAYGTLNAQGIELGRSASLFLYQTSAALAREQPLEQQLGDIRRRLAELPAVERVSQSHSSLQDFIKSAVVAGRSGAQHPVELKRIDQEYLGMTGHRLVSGRDFSAAEVQQSDPVALVNSVFALTLERDGGALGTQLSRGGTAHTVVGIVDDLAYPGATTATPRIYLPASEAGQNFILRFRPGQAMSRQQLVEFVAVANPGFGVFLYDDLDRQGSDLLLPRRLVAVSSAMISLLVVLVAGLGLYGMVRYTTRVIRSEIGARLAFGARAHHIVLMLIRGNLTAIALGSVLGIAALVLVLPAMGPSLGLPEVNLGLQDLAIAFGALSLLAVLACHLSARPLLTDSPAAVMRDLE